MIDILKLAAAFAAIVLLLRAKLKIGYVLMLGSVSLMLMYAMRPGDILLCARRAIEEPAALKLFLALVFIRMLELVLREHKMLEAMMDSFRLIFRSTKATIVSMPLLIGTLPSVGGAYFSAPMVDEATRGMDLQAEEKSFINYWFRHPWEYVLPLYPGVLLAAALTGHSVRAIITANMPYALTMLATGFVFSMRGVPRHISKGRVTPAGLMVFAPLVIIFVLVMVAGLRLDASVGLVVLGLLLYYKYAPRDWFRVLRHGVSIEVLFLILGVMLFKSTMDVAGAVDNISAFFVRSGIPLMPVLFALPFVVGMLTGLTIGFVGATFPLILSLPGGESLAAISFAFASGFAGVMLSPVHVCLVLTREYFCAPMVPVHRRLFLPMVVILAVAAAEYLILR